ncbi:MAG TPA: hypothetical protein VN036_10515, partial [Devosia sp.]|nr:hypothetical protein [Devosia sp.]
ARIEGFSAFLARKRFELSRWCRCTTERDRRSGGWTPFAYCEGLRVFGKDRKIETVEFIRLPDGQRQVSN